MTCSECQAVLPPTARFCGTCGKRVQESCPECLASVAEHRAYCLSCGARLTGAAHLDLPASDRRVVTVLFADVEGFTALSSRLDPERVTEILNAFFAALSEPVYRCGGVVDKYMGDALMALFGAPIAHEDDPERAVRAGLEMQSAAREFAAQLETRTGIRLAVRVGINTGLVVAGAVGSGAKRDYTVMGDAVNLAQRLETAAPPGMVYVGEATYKVTKERFEYELVGTLTLKGLPAPVPAYRPVSVRPIPRGEFRERAPMVGRRSELTRLLACLDNLRGGIVQVVGLVGEAGIGKSRLAREFLDRIRRRGEGRILRVRCPSYGRQHALHMVSALVQEWLDLGGTVDAERIQAALHARAMAAGYPDAAAAAELIAGLLGIAGEHAASEGTARQRRDAGFSALADLLVADARHQPLVMSIDDLHWADLGSLEWLNAFIDRLADQHEPLPVLILYQARPRNDQGTAEWAGKVDLTQIVLGPLPPGDQRALLAVALGLPASPTLWPDEIARLADHVLGRSEGNPLFLWELVKGLIDSKLLRRTPTHWEVTRQPDDADLPTSIKGVVSARLDALPHGLRTLIQVASVVGRNFSLDLLAELVPGDVVALTSELVARDFLHCRENGELAFNQAIIQEVAYESLLLSARKDLHRKAGEALERLLGDRRRDAAEVLAYHFSRAGEAAKAAEYLHRAGRRALAAYANADARRAFEQALAFAPAGSSGVGRAEILSGLAEVEALLGEYIPALAHAREALRDDLDPRQTAELHALVARTLDRQGAYQDALLHLEQAIAELASRAPDVVPRLLLETAWIEMRIGNYDAALALARQALERITKSPAASGVDLARAHGTLGVCHYRRNEWDLALDHHGRALELRTQGPDLMGIADALQNLGLVHYQRGDWPAALDHYHRGLALYERLGDVAKLITLQLNLGSLELDMGQIDEALLHLEKTRDLAERTGNTFMWGVSQIGIGNALAALSRTEEALAQLEDGLAVLERIEALEVQPEAHQILGRILLASGRQEEGLAHLERGLELADQMGDRLQKGIILRHLAAWLGEQWRLQEARATLDQAAAVLTGLGSKLEVARALLISADLLGRQDKLADARAALLEATAAFARIGAVLDLERARGLQAALEDASS